MKHEIKIELLDANLFSLIQDKSARPDGLTIKGPIFEQANAIDLSGAAPHIIAVISFAGVIAADAAKDFAKERIKNWLAEYLARHKATRTRINGQESQSRADAERIIGEAIEIGKND